MRQEIFEAAGALSRQSLEHVFKVSIRIVAVELGGLDQAHDHGGALAGAQGAGEEPV